MTSKTDLCILLFGDRKPKHVDHEEDARVYVEAIAEIKKLRAENEALFVKNVHLTGNQLKTETVDLIAELRRERDRLRADMELLRGANMELRGENVRLRAEVEALRAALQRLADRRYDLCPTQIVHIVNTALRGEGE